MSQSTPNLSNENNAEADSLGVYPEKVHVKAFPERRYLKTSRVMVILSLFSLGITVCLGLWYRILLTEQNVSLSFSDYLTGTRLLYVDTADNMLKRVFREKDKVSAIYLLSEKLIYDFITERYSFRPYLYMMKDRRGPNSLLSAYDLAGKNNALFNLREQYYLKRRVSRVPHIYDIRIVRGNLLEAYYDVFEFSKNSYRKLRKCKCSDGEIMCLDCKKKYADKVDHYKALVRVSFTREKLTPNQKAVNPSGFQIQNFVEFPKTKGWQEGW